MKLKRPSRPEPCSPHTSVAKKGKILDRVREAIKVRDWECADQHKVYPSIRLKAFTALMEGEDWKFSIWFAFAVSEAVGIDPWDDDGPIMPVPVPAPPPTIEYVRVTPPPRPQRRLPNPNQLALDLAA